jgi:succinate dehydrogenase / fumarate reductase membrane anchor subunit
VSGLHTPRKRVEGLGSAKHGAGIWKLERFTSLILIPLLLWGLWEAPDLAVASRDMALAWLRDPLHLVLGGTLLAITLWHMEMGLRVVIEDYIHGMTGAVLVLLNTLFCWGLGLAAAAAVLSAVFGVGIGAP